MHAMDEFMDRIMYGDNTPKPAHCNCFNESSNTAELRQIRQELKNCITELKSLHESKDRVDISLKEYEELKRVNKDLLSRLNDAERLLGAIGITADMVQNIDCDTVKTYSTDHVIPAAFERRIRYRIEFDVVEDYV